MRQEGQSTSNDVASESTQSFSTFHAQHQKAIPLHQKIIDQIIAKWFLIGICCIILLAFLFPFLGKKGGIFKSDITSKIAIAMIFFCSGYNIKSQVMLRAIKLWQLHVFIQVFSFVVFPAITYAIVSLLGLVNFNKLMLEGLVIMSCIPTTVTSNVVVTAQAEGNEAAAIFSAAFGNSIGVFITPSLLYFFYADAEIFNKVPIGTTFLNLCLTVIIPLIVGQANRILHAKAKAENARVNKVSSLAGSWLLLYVLFCVFCDVFDAKVELSLTSIFGTLGIVVFLHVLVNVLVFYGAKPKFWRFSRADRIAAFFCATQKTLALGLALMDSIFGADPDFMLVTVPLIMYHPIQILASGILVPKLKEWKREEEDPEYPFVATEPK